MARVAAEPLPSRPIVPHRPARCSACNAHLEFPVPQPPPAPGISLRVRCYACHAVFTPTSPSAAASSTTPSSTATSVHSPPPPPPPPAPPPPPPRKTRLIGTQERPLETEYYDLLCVAPSASLDDIKKSYRRLAIKHHPDKNLSDPSAAERFKRISIAYQTLSDSALRAKYNEFGAKAGTPEGGYVDPEEVFGAMFGGERFVPIIGNISLAKEMKAAMQEGAEEEEDEGLEGRVSDVKGAGEMGSAGVVAATHSTGGGERKRDVKVLSPEEKAAKDEKARKKAAEKAAAREARVSTLVANLERKLSIFTESALGPTDPAVSSSWRQICAIEASELVRESYGYELLQTTGFVYLSKAKHHLASHQTLFGVGGWFHNVQGKYHVFSETVSTLRSAMELKSVFDQLQAAEKAGGLSDEERKKLEEQAAEKGLQALFKGTKLEVEGVLREVCDRVLAVDEATGGREKAVLRAVALQMLGDAYMAVKRDPNAPGLLHGFGQARAHPHAEGVGEDSEYVKVETNASRERARSTTGRAGR